MVVVSCSGSGCCICSCSCSCRCLPIYLSVCLSVCLSVYLSICLSASSKTQLFCDISSIFELVNIQNEAILRDFLQKWKVECRADGLVPMRFAIFPLHLSKVLRLSRKIIFPKLKIWCSKMQPISGNQRPDLLTSLMNMPLVLRLPREMHLCRSSSNAPRLPDPTKLH